MKKQISLMLCATALLSMTACAKEKLSPLPMPKPIISVSECNLTDAAEKTLATTSFSMTGTASIGGSSRQYELKINGYGTSGVHACGFVEVDGSREVFSIDGSIYRYQKPLSDGTQQAGVADLGDYPCDALAVCDLMMSIIGSDDILSSANTDFVETNGTVTFTATLSLEQLTAILPNKPEGTASEISVSIQVSGDGYCTAVALSYQLDGQPQEYRLQFSQLGVTQAINQLAVTTVTQADWSRVFSPSNFENVTITRYFDDHTKGNPTVQMISGSVSSKSFVRNTTGQSLVGTIYYYQLGSQFLELEHGTVTHSDGSKSAHYLLTPTDRYTGETSASFLSFLESKYGFSGKYEAFTYDEQSGTYRLENTEDNQILRYELRFDDGRLTYIKCASENKETGAVSYINSYYFTDYGTTTIVIPSA